MLKIESQEEYQKQMEKEMAAMANMENSKMKS
jgi:hypothetical protein